jgi:pimeloyl-ACP methyl ester carboxylesterase
MTEFGVTNPSRLAAAIYLDASFDFSSAYQRSHRPGKLNPSDTTSVAFRAWRDRYAESRLTPSIRAAIAATEEAWQIDPVNAARRQKLVAPLATEVRSRPHEPWRIKAPALALCAGGSFDRGLGWLTPDSTRWKEAHAYYERVSTEKHEECERLNLRNGRAKVVMLDSGHYVFMDARQKVVDEMRRFLAGI